MTKREKAEIIDIVRTLLILVDQVRQARSSGSLLQSTDTNLTPVNGIFGQLIGRILDGRKTLIGGLGLVAVTILPELFPELAPLSDALKKVASEPSVMDAETVHTLLSAATPLFSALFGWGVLGKVDKWVAEVKSIGDSTSARQ